MSQSTPPPPATPRATSATGTGTTDGVTILLASGNAHKAAEFAQLAAAAGAPVQFVSAAAVGGMPAVAEDTGTFLGNARQKALALRERALAAGTAGGADATGGTAPWVMADDSGLCCDALGGAPGVETANYAGTAAPAAANRAKLLNALRDVPDAQRGARFVCLLLLIAPDGTEHVFTGECAGRILRGERGTGGFGYDPVFALGAPDDPARDPRSYAELAPDEKNATSHRGRAFAALARFLRDKKAP
ncbi:MAG: non-canonical purine NTP pyrophosphatase [Puniceicoccales bacterium]|jgi:XTP/dITP diphosphohydrolase|nr:non-canonical purine NTP pyrophosphatase [Puniceicoccales bacterium]